MARVDLGNAVDVGTRTPGHLGNVQTCWHQDTSAALSIVNASGGEANLAVKEALNLISAGWCKLEAELLIATTHRNDLETLVKTVVSGSGHPDPKMKEITCNSKRPQEPALELPLMRQAEFLAMMSRGQTDAEATVVKAGFLGGDSWFAVCGVGLQIGCGIFMVLKLIVSWLNGNFVGQDIGYMMGGLCFTVGFSLRCILIAQEKWRKAQWVLTGTLMSLGLSMVVYAIGLAAGVKDQAREARDEGVDATQEALEGVAYVRAAFSAITGLGFVIGAFKLLIRQRRDAHYSILLACFGGILTLSAAVVESIMRDEGLAMLGMYAIVICCLSLGIGTNEYSFRKKRNAAYASIENDKAKYDIIWDTVLTVKGNQDIARELKLLTSKVKEGEPTAKLTRDVHRDLREVGRKKPRQLMSSLVVLFAQAASINAHFQEMVAGWGDGFQGAHVHKCSVKRRRRAIEKLYRSYNCQADYLLDLVRSSIVFETLGELFGCLTRISDDERVAILQIKNRMALDYDSKASAGYRNVSVSLAIVDDYTMRLGVDTHVCELQLSLEAFEKEKNDEGHKRYVSFRDALAE